MKKLTAVLLLLLAFNGQAQVTVKEQSVNIDGNKNGFYISLPYGDKKHVEKELKEELKSWKGKYTSKDNIFVDDCKLKEMGDNTFDVFAKVEENSDGGAFVSIAIDLGGAFMSSSEHAAKSKAIEARLLKFGIKTAKSAVDEEIKEEEKAVKEREKELEDLQKEQEKLEKEIEDLKEKIKENEKSIEGSKKSQEDKKGEIDAQKKKLEAVQKKKEAVK